MSIVKRFGCVVSWLRRGPFSCAIDVAHDAIPPSSALATKTSVGAESTFATAAVWISLRAQFLTVFTPATYPYQNG